MECVLRVVLLTLLTWVVLSDQVLSEDSTLDSAECVTEDDSGTCMKDTKSLEGDFEISFNNWSGLDLSVFLQRSSESLLNSELMSLGVLPLGKVASIKVKKGWSVLFSNEERGYRMSHQCDEYDGRVTVLRSLIVNSELARNPRWFEHTKRFKRSYWLKSRKKNHWLSWYPPPLIPFAHPRKSLRLGHQLGQPLCEDPFVFRMDSLLSEQECRLIISHSQQKGLHDSSQRFREQQKYTEVNLAMDDSWFRLVSERVMIAIGEQFNDEHLWMSEVRIAKYSAPDGEFAKHTDFFDGASTRNRYLTALVYLNDMTDSEGGLTVFTDPTCHNRSEQWPPPKVGDSLIWYNLDFDGNLLLNTEHGSTPLTRGEKWILTFWLYVGSPGYH